MIDIMSEQVFFKIIKIRNCRKCGKVKPFSNGSIPFFREFVYDYYWDSWDS